MRLRQIAGLIHVGPDHSLGPAPRPGAARRHAGVQGLLTLAVAVVVVAGLYLGREVMIPIILAVLLSFLLAPLVNLLRRMHLGRVPSALLAVVLALGVILTFGTVIGTQLAELAPGRAALCECGSAEGRHGAAGPRSAA